MTTSFLDSTKTFRPRVAHNVIERPYLLKKLQESLNKKLTLVVAPSGYGKSTLVSDWLEKSKLQYAWLSLDKSHDTLVSFIKYLVGAVQTTYTKVGQNTLNTLSQIELPPENIINNILINELNQVKQPFILVLDDYQVIHDLKIHNFIEKIIDSLPNGFHLVILSRINPPFDIKQLRQKNQLVEVSMQDLQFRKEETYAFIQQNLKISPNESVISLIQDQTHGWITGLRLSILSLSGPEDIEKLTEPIPDNRMVLELLFQRAFNKQPKAIQMHLLRTSILQKFNAELVDYLQNEEGGEENYTSGEEFIQWLLENCAFVFSLDKENNWFRYQLAFQDLLQKQLAQTLSQDEIRNLHLRASELYEKYGLIDEAIQHSIEANDADRAARIIERHRDEILSSDSWETLERWFSFIPGEVLKQHPLLILTNLWYHHVRANYQELQNGLQMLDHAISKQDNLEPQILGESEFFHGAPKMWMGEVDQAVEHLERAVKLISPDNIYVRGAAELYLATTYQMRGEFDKAVKFLNGLLKSEQLKDARRARLTGAIIFIHLFSGDLYKAFQYTKQLKELTKELYNPFFTGWASYFSGVIHFFWGNYQAAISNFQDVIKNQFFWAQDPNTDAFTGLLLSYQALGMEEKAQETSEQLSIYISKYGKAPYDNVSRSARVRLAILQGDLEQALYLQQVVDFAKDQGVMVYWIE